MSDPAQTTLIIGPNSALSEAIRSRLSGPDQTLLTVTRFSETGIRQALDSAASIGAVIFMLPPPQADLRLMEVEDHHLDAVLEDLLDLFSVLGVALPRMAPRGAVLVIGSRGHLGAWGGAHEMALSGAIAGLVRAIALESMERGVRANQIALDPPGQGATPIDAIADLAAFLVSAAAVAVNGELILANAGRSLKMREARDRRAPASARQNS